VSYTLNHNLEAANYDGFLDKAASAFNLLPGQDAFYTISYFNHSNVSIDSFYIYDALPAEVRLTSFSTGLFYSNTPTGSVDLTVNYKTNLNSTWTATPGSPMALNANDTIDVSTLGLAVNEYITEISWVLGPDAWPIGSGISSTGLIRLDYYVDPAAAAGVMQNCVTFGGSDPTVVPTSGSQCVDININATVAGVQIDPTAWYPEETNYQSIGDTIDMYLSIRNNWISSDSLRDGVIYNLLPPELEYVPGTWVQNWSSSGTVPSPVFTETADYNGTGRTLLKFAWQGASDYVFARNESVQVNFKAVITDEAAGGPSSFSNAMVSTASNETQCGGTYVQDIFDVDNDGNTTESLCQGDISFNINPIVSIESEKLVKGQLDSTYTKYPQYGNTVPGGIADYQLEIRNLGNVSVDSITIIDILPFVDIWCRLSPADLS
ncbi:MAG: hypothetical protein AAFO94_19215, partial [Bacteroidota bacterium]